MAAGVTKEERDAAGVVVAFGGSGGSGGESNIHYLASYDPSRPITVLLHVDHCQLCGLIPTPHPNQHDKAPAGRQVRL